MLGTIYRNARTRISGLAGALGREQATAPVPATPGWTVHELLAHVVGVAADVSNGRMDGAPGDAWTARHVGERRDRPVDELLAEWDHVGPVVERSLPEQHILGPNPVADVICHEADLHEALGLPRVDREHWEPFLDLMMLFLRKRLRDNMTLLIRDEQGQQWSCGSGEPATLLRADGYELLRAAFSRRSRRQIAAWDWTRTPAGQTIERIGLFGPRDDDQPIPVA